MGEWIEIFVATKYGLTAKVSPFMGEWIEIRYQIAQFTGISGLTLHG